MPGNHNIVYWDANVFLSYVNEVPGRMPVLSALMEQSRNDEITIYTSALSRVEVAFSDSEQQARAPNPEIESQLDNLWANRNVVRAIETLPAISLNARGLIRAVLTYGWSLKPPDAIHLATARWLLNEGISVDEFHTYDASLFKYADVVGFDVLEPYVEQRKLTSP